MSKWNDSFEEKGSADAEKRVLSAVGPILDRKAQRKAAAPKPALGWLRLLVPTAALAGLALLVAPQLRQGGKPVAEGDLAANEKELDMEIAMDLPLIRDLREIDQMELLQQLGDPSEWTAKKKSPTKS